MSDIQFAEGIYFNDPHEKAPDFVLGGIAIRPEVLKLWLDSQHPNEKGYIKLQVKRAKSGKPYVALDTFKPQSGQGSTQSGPTLPDDDSDGIPF